jgi:uncharacterized HAD superfamily protein
MKIGFDLDGVIYPWHWYVYNDMHKNGLVDATYDVFWSSGMWKEEGYQEIISKYAKDPLLYGYTIESSVEISIRALANLDTRFFFVTQRPENCAISTVNWINNNIRGILTPDIYVCKDKIEVLKKLHSYVLLDYYLEDRIELAEKVSALGIKTLLITTPYNRDDVYSGKRFDSTQAAINYMIYNREVLC